MPESLYVHIPFCRRKCLYCDFVSYESDAGMRRRYVDALCKELGLLGGHALKTLYIGGGTPTMLSAGELAEIVRAVKHGFALAPDCEATIEANPGTLDAGKLDALFSSGINRMSIGVQSLNDRDLVILGRIHNAEEAVESVSLARSAGFKNISIDLMYGIPGQDIGSWRETLSAAVLLGPEHISAYELTPEKGTPLYDALGKGKLALPPEDERAEMFFLAREILESAGFAHYEISNYARPGKECAHNMNYWRRGEYLGAGAGAHAFVNGERRENTRDAGDYITALEGGGLPVVSTFRPSEEEALQEQIFLGLRTSEGIIIGDWASDKLGAFIEALSGEGLAVKEGESLRLTHKGFAVSNSVITGIFRAMGI